MAAGKLKFVALNKPGTVDYAWIPAEEKTSDADVADHAVQIILEHKPQLMFVHFPSTDNVGHAIGWGTPAQIAAVEGADAALGRVLAALTEAKTIDSTVIILTADHGGQGRGHGKNDARSRHIPWIAVGPGIKKNVDLTTIPQRVINTEDTFATVCWLLGVPVDEADIDGKPVTEILARKEMLEPKK
jgi:phosphopentomutase